MNLNIVLYQPEIPQNTGNIARTCVLTNSKLHLIKPLGFKIDEKSVRRAGLDYWKDLDMEIHESFEDFMEKYQGER
ncbi:MAG: TrmH family RNA methyltransferase, partial [Clostridiaceae bacterium]